jgi:hypothetical protein
MKTIAVFVLLSVVFLAPQVGTAGLVLALGPTDLEQYLVEVMNRARANPNAEVARLSSYTWSGNTPDLNEGLSAGTISPAPKPPLAINLDLTEAARAHVAWSFNTNSFSHIQGPEPIPNNVCWTGNTPGDRATAAGYNASSIGENIAAALSSIPFSNQLATAEHLHNILFVDNNYPGRGHRINVLNPNWVDVGVAVGFGTNYQGWSHGGFTAHDFGTSSTSGAYLTGVVINDADQNQFYSPGEGLPNFQLQVVNTSNSAISGNAASWTSGGYKIPIHTLPAGSYSLQSANGMPLLCQQDYSGNWGTCDFSIPTGGATQNIGLTVAAVPEPSGWAFMLTIAIGLGAVSITKSKSRGKA